MGYRILINVPSEWKYCSFCEFSLSSWHTFVIQYLFPICAEYILLSTMFPRMGWPLKYPGFYVSFRVVKYHLLVSQVSNSHSVARCLQSLILILINALGCQPHLLRISLATGLPCAGTNWSCTGSVAAPCLLRGPWEETWLNIYYERSLQVIESFFQIRFPNVKRYNSSLKLQL